MNPYYAKQLLFLRAIGGCGHAQLVLAVVAWAKCCVDTDTVLRVLFGWYTHA